MILRIRDGKSLRDVDIPSNFEDLKVDQIIDCLVDGKIQQFIVDIPLFGRGDVLYVRPVEA
jgi:hypothetical protein